MSLTGALLSGVSGLQAQSNAMGIISDNIANLNTVGYKISNATFSTLVVNSAATTTYSPGGVQSGRFALVATQGTLQASNSPLDVAITGNGFFPVNDQGSGNGNSLYTRAGSFHQDVQGRLVNSAGMFLEGWALTQAGAIANVNKLQVVSVGTTNGVAVGTQNVTVGANLDSSQTIFASNAAGTLTSPTNGAITSQTLDLGPALGLTVGDQFSLTVDGATTTYTYNDGTLAPAAGVPLNASSLAQNQFNSLADLANDINNTTGLQASIGGTAAAPTLSITSPYAVTMADVTNTPGSTLFGVVSGTATTASYVPGDIQNGTVTAQFNDPVQVFDDLGTAHTLNLSVIRTGTNLWSYELFDTDADIAGVTAGRGLISAGTIQFNGDGTLNSVTAAPAALMPAGITNQPLYGGNPTAPIPVAPAGLAAPLVSGVQGIIWSNGAKTSDITFNLGTAGAIGTGKTDGLTQFASAFNKNFTNQDGAAVGLQTGVTIDKNGFVIASYSNGATQKLFQVPVTTFADPSQLQAQDGNTYSATVASGNFNWRIAGTGGSGTIAPSSLEESNADLGDEFANMITTQTAYSANSKTITTSQSMLQQLLQIIQG